VKVEANVAAQRRKKRWEIDNLMELPADVPSGVVGTVLDPLPTHLNAKMNTLNQWREYINKSFGFEVSLMSKR
jgi:hypothetical protein